MIEGMGGPVGYYHYLNEKQKTHYWAFCFILLFSDSVLFMFSIYSSSSDSSSTGSISSPFQKPTHSLDCMS